MKRFAFLILFIVAAFFGLFAATGDTTNPSCLQGNIADLSGQAGTLQQKITLAQNTFKQGKAGDYFFIAYGFTSRHTIHHGCNGKNDAQTIQADGGKIKIVANNDRSHDVSIQEKETPTTHPAVLISLYQRSKPDALCDVSMLDAGEQYRCGPTPVYWLGQIENEESRQYLEAQYPAGSESVKKDVLFLMSSHGGVAACNFLKRVALGTESRKVRETAIFWLGCANDVRTIADLQEIYQKMGEPELRKNVVFALSMCKAPEAVQQMIAIARHDSSLDVRKDAVFWLGQKASAASIKELGAIANTPGEQDELKKQAVFAISQLPNDKAVPMLITIARTNLNPQLRKEAIFWLGQTGAPAALNFFAEILGK